MAARRLIAILIVLLALSSILAALAPQPAVDEETTSTTSTEQTDAKPLPEGRLLERTINPEPDQPQLIELSPGDQLQLTVRVAGETPVQIPGLGENAFASPGAPARFDLLLRTTGKYAVTVDGGKAVARLQVSR